MRSPLRRFLGVGVALFLMLIAPALLSGSPSAALVSSDSAVPNDDVIDIVLDVTTTTSSTIVPSTTTTVAPTTTEPGSFEMGVAAPQHLLVDSQIATGHIASGIATTVNASGLKPFSTVTFTLQPEGIVIASATTDASGNAIVNAAFPSEIAEGTHLIVVEGVLASGEQVSSTGAFVVDASGVVSDVVAPSESYASPPSLADAQRALDAGAPLYDTAANVATTAAVAVGVAVVGAISGGGGSGSSRSSGDSSDSSSETGDQSPRGDASDTSRDTHSQGEVGSLDMDELQHFDHDRESWGDRGRFWRLPGSSHAQQLVASMYGWADSHSVALSRILRDGQWLRAAFGPLQLFVAYLGLLLGVLGGVSTHGMVVLPPMALVFTVMTLSVFDALVGAMAWLGFAMYAVCRGEVTSIFDVRTLVGMALTFFALPLIANHARPLRRPVDKSLVSYLDRIGDYVLTPIVVGFAASAVLNALNGLSGLQMVAANDAAQIRWIAAGAIIARMLGEDIVVRGFPQRLKATHLDPGDGIGTLADYGTVCMKGALFLLASSSFFGLGWRTWLMVALMTLVPFLKITQERYPNFWWLKHWFPQGVVRTVMMMFVGTWFAHWILRTSASPMAAKELAPLLMLPGIALGLIDLVGRSGGRWPNAVWTRLLAAGFWVFVLGVMLGRFSI